MSNTSFKKTDQRLREAYDELEKSALEPDVKIAVKAFLTMRQAINWSQAVTRGIGYQVDPALIKYIRASSAPDLPKLVNEVLEKLPFDLVFQPVLGEFALDLYPNQSVDEQTRKNWQLAYVRLKRETIPLLLISKKLYQNTDEEMVP